MASVVNRPNGHKWIQVKVGGKRRTIRLGQANEAMAFEFRRRVADLAALVAMQQPPDTRTLEWLAGLDPQLYDRLAAAGLVRQGSSAGTLTDLIAAHSKSLDVKDSSRSTLSHTARNLKEYFGAGFDYRRITQGDAMEFRAWLSRFGRSRGKGKGGPLAGATVSRRCRRARQLFTFAVKKHWIADNPFEGMKGWTESNRDRDHYVSIEVLNKLLAHSDPEMRLLIAVTRLAGVRCGSEIWPMSWDWFNWADGTIRVRAPKTTRYPNGSVRTVPIDERLLPLLNAGFAAAPDGATLLFPDSQISNYALTKRLELVCDRAGVTCWKKPWNNMRASCETDWIAKHGDIFKVATWMGHSPQVALEHYSRIAKEHSTIAAGASINGPNPKQKPKQPYAPMQ